MATKRIVSVSKTVANELPPDVLKSDLKWMPNKGLTFKQVDELGLGNHSRLQFYFVPSMGWVLTTLLIKHSNRSTDRFYAVKLDGRVCRVGMGPHVTKETVVYLRSDNVKRLARYIELLRKGLADANTIRDRISTRRAQGQLHRAAGRTSWMW